MTVAALIARYRTYEIPFHMKKAVENGVTRDEIIEVITHLEFYSGWPIASTAPTIARDALGSIPQRNPSQEKNDAEA